MGAGRTFQDGGKLGDLAAGDEIVLLVRFRVI